MMKGIFSLIFLCGLTPLAHARTVFVGGVGSQSSTLRACFPGMQTFGLSDAQERVSTIAASLNQLLAAGEKVKIVGHSTGATVAEHIALKIKPEYRANIELVELDGIGSLKTQLAIPNSSCWYAVGKSGARSRNASSMVQCKHPHPISNNTCHTQWCLHFALVNPNVPANLNGGTFRYQGYSGCGGSIGW